MNAYKTTLPVYMIFFNRAEPLKKVFAAVKEARPQYLFLAQDGPRPGRDDDIENIKKCRDVVSDIDWDCKVYTNYSEENLGCGMRMYTGLNWAFETVDRIAILEDDCVPSQDFFPFCEEVLEKYKDDQRICLVTGMNHVGEYKNCPYSYLFSKVCSCWGWATWRRVWADMDYDMNFLDDKYAMDCFVKKHDSHREAVRLVKTGKERKNILKTGGRLSAWTYQSGMSLQHLNERIDIVPTKNFITNIGLTEDSGHATNNIKKIPKGLQQVFFEKTYKIEFPLKHPKYIVEDRQYEKMVKKIMGTGFFRNLYRRIEGIIRRMIYS